MNFTRFMARAAGRDDIEPWPWQMRVAEEGLPDLLDVPTGTGKTAGTVLGWLYRRIAHPDVAVRQATPRRLVFVLPTRVLVEQVEGEILGWLTRLGLDDRVGQRTLMGGAGTAANDWRLRPAQDLILVGTLDMILSRSLNRGFGVSRWTWPIDFGLLNADCHYVFDEVQLMGPALETSRQLDGLRQAVGVASPCRSTWMSATVDPTRLHTVDAVPVETAVRLSDDDRHPRPGASEAALRRTQRLSGTRTIRRAELSDGDQSEERAAVIAAHHRAGTLTLAVLNTVDAARTLHTALAATLDLEPILLHSRFRPEDRRRQARAALSPVDPHGPGRVVVSTQVVEAGVDISASLLFTEAAPFPSIIQRVGRCNRDGFVDEAAVLWGPPGKAPPYPEADVDAAVAALEGLEGQEVTSEALRDLDVPVTPTSHSVLRRRDLLDLFDTTPDLAGNDVDVGMYLRDTDDLDVQVCWRDIDLRKAILEKDQVTKGPPAREELCPVPIPEINQLLRKKGGPRCWRFDHLDGVWQAVDAASVRPGQVLLLASSAGCYRPDLGWDRQLKDVVPPVGAEVTDVAVDALDEATGDDPASYTRSRWIGLTEHLADVGNEVRELGADLDPSLDPRLLDAAVLAGDLHDLGKAHDVFQDTMARCAPEERREAVAAQGPWAKSGGGGRASHRRRYFRHELVSALALLAGGQAVLGECPEPELVIYLVAAHHGRVRLGIRSLPDEHSGPGRRVALGVADGDPVPAVELPEGRLPETTLSLDPMGLGRAADGTPSWAEMALRLRDREDLGPFRLAYLEALVRLADWRVSARYDAPSTEATGERP